MYFFDYINIDGLQSFQKIYSEEWFDDIRQLYGENLSDEMITQSVVNICDFFHIEEPAIVSEDWTTGVYPNNDFTLQDDILIFNRERLLDMGILGKDGLDLVMTHEGTHRVLQGMEELGFSSHQEELCCDYMAGVRAGLNSIDVSQMENSLMYTLESETHPAGVERVESIEAGVRFAQFYYAEYNMAPTFNECLDNFCDINEIEQGTLNDNNPTFKGYTQEEINSRKKKAELDMSHWKGEMRSHGELAKHDMWKGSEMAHIRDAERKYEAAKQEYNKWSNMQPDKK